MKRGALFDNDSSSESSSDEEPVQQVQAEETPGANNSMAQSQKIAEAPK